MIPQRWALLPWADDAPVIHALFYGITATPLSRRIRLATGRVDRWRWIPVQTDGEVVIETDAGLNILSITTSPLPVRTTAVGIEIPAGDGFTIVKSTPSKLVLGCDLVGVGTPIDTLQLERGYSDDWQVTGTNFGGLRAGSLTPSLVTSAGQLIVVPGVPDVDGLRTWERQLIEAPDGSFHIPLRFRIRPGIWPEIELTEAEGTDSDVKASAHLLELQGVESGNNSLVSITIDRVQIDIEGRDLRTGSSTLEIPGEGPFDLRVITNGTHALILAGQAGPLLVAAIPREEIAASVRTTNIEGFVVNEASAHGGRIYLTTGATVAHARVYGLRTPVTNEELRASLTIDLGNELYRNEAFTVFDGAVIDRSGDNPAYVPDRCTIISPVRTIEEFTWRANDLGDMTRVVDRQTVWRSQVDPTRYPHLASGYRTVDAAFELAMETFQRNASEEFALPGLAGMWSAGYFQGNGLGFGVWKRDSAHIALRTGTLLDPEVARRTLAHVVNSGFDNGSDGDVLPAVAILDYVQITGDETLVRETWSQLVEAVARLDARFDNERNLIHAAQSTSNDCFDESEAGGYALSTEIYALGTYRAMAALASYIGGDTRSVGWTLRANAMTVAIRDNYWNGDAGYYTSGPIGSTGYRDAVWETSGVEAALGGLLGQDPDRDRSMLKRVHDVAMSPFGIVLFPHREKINHFCGSIWYCWQAGFAGAAARLGDAQLVRQLISQQVRSVVRNKTFFEVTEAESGESWRWPGQLWHAAGFSSLVLWGLLGVSITEKGMSFTPAVTAEFAGMKLSGLRFRSAIIDIEVLNYGTSCEITLDGVSVDYIAPDTTGRHNVVLRMK